MEHRCMTQPGSDEMVYRVLLEHAATNSAKSSEQSAQSETNSASDLGGDKGSNIPPILKNTFVLCSYQSWLHNTRAGNDSDRCASFLSMESGRATSQGMEAAGAKYFNGQA